MCINSTTKNITSEKNTEDKELILQCINVLSNENISYVDRLVNEFNTLNSLQNYLEERLEDYTNGASNDDGFLELEATLLGVLLLVTGNESSDYVPHSLFSIALDEISYYEPDDQMCRELRCLYKYSKFKDPYYLEPHQLPISNDELNLPTKRKKDALAALCESRNIDKKGTIATLKTRIKEWSEKQITMNELEIGDKNERMYKIIS